MGGARALAGDEFLDDFPTVKREQTVALLEHAEVLLVSPAR
jgi:hypothetical protein